jgi:hypothetical protein
VTSSLTHTDELTVRLAADALAFVRVYRWPIVVAVGAAVLAHGVALTSASLSADEELLVVQPGLSGLWSGRPVMTLVKAMTRDLMPLPYWNTALALVLLLVAGMAFAFLLTRAAARPGTDKAAVTLFLVVFLTLPLTAFWLMWGEAAIAYAFGFTLAAVSALLAWLSAAEGWGRSAALAAAAMATFTSLTYQSQVFVAVAGILAANVAFNLRAERRSVALRDDFRFSLRLLSPVFVGGAVGGALAVGFIWRFQGDTGYHAGLLGWGDVDLVTIIGDLGRQVAGYATGEGFFGGWVLIPTLVVAGALMLQLAANAFHGPTWWNVVLLLGLVLTPFGTSIVLGTALPQRAMHALPLAAGAVWLLWAFAFRRSTLRTAILVAATIALTVWHSGVTSRLYYVEQSTYETDRLIASSIVDRLAQQGWDGTEVPFVSVGTRPRTTIEDIDLGDAFGVTSFNELQGGIRSVAFMQAMGHPVGFPTFEQRASAIAAAETMPDWPAQGAVMLRGGVAIVRFAEPRFDNQTSPDTGVRREYLPGA